MIKDNIKNAESYFGLSDRIKYGLEWIQNNNLKDFNDGRYELSDDIYANIQSYQTKDSAPFEAHRKYIDIQYMIKGEENCGFTDYNTCKTKEKYDPDKDIEFLTTESAETLTLKEGEFFIFMPQDAHQPALDTVSKNFVKKVIVKVKI